MGAAEFFAEFFELLSRATGVFLRPPRVPGARGGGATRVREAFLLGALGVQLGGEASGVLLGAAGGAAGVLEARAEVTVMFAGGVRVRAEFSGLRAGFG